MLMARILVLMDEAESKEEAKTSIEMSFYKGSVIWAAIAEHYDEAAALAAEDLVDLTPVKSA